MLKQYYPSGYCPSVFAIDYDKLWNLGYRGLIFDIDNTLVHHGAPSTEKVDALFKNLQEKGFKTFLLTNNEKSRVEDFIQNITTPYICEANKPDPKNYLKAVEQLQLAKDQVICIGDQIFTDILGANKSQLKSILVHFIQLPGETKIGKKRYLEKVILKFFALSKLSKTPLGKITKKGAI